MLISEAIEQANVLTGQSLPVEALVRWLSEMDGRLAFEFYRVEGWLPYDPVDDLETELLVPFPWDGMYVHHLEAMTYFTNAEYDRYENARTLSEKTLADFRAFMQRTQAKLCGGGFPTEKTGGTYTTVIPEQAQSPWFWVNAYSLAVQHGFAGTEDEWLESLVGPKGDKGDPYTILGLYPTLAALEAAHPTGKAGDAYAVGDEDENTTYNWDVDAEAWVNIGPFRGPQGETGETGATGAAAGFGTVSATVDGNTGTPGVNVLTSGPDTAKNIAFEFVNLKGETGATGAPGADGVSPGVTISEIAGGHSVTITDAYHPSGQSFNVMDGEDGEDGADGDDGVSPGVSVSTITGGHTVTITDAEHPSGQSFNVMDGADGTSFVIKGLYATYADLIAAHPTGSAGDAYAVGTDTSNTTYLWDVDATAWTDVGPIKGPKGDTGAAGQDGSDGVSPEVTITSITGGHTVTITDKDHPSGQSFNVTDGTNGQDGAPGPNTVTTSTTTNLTGILKGNGSEVSAIADGSTGQVLKMGSSGPEWGAAPTTVNPYTSTPAMDGTGSAGSSADYSRGDHVHPSQIVPITKYDYSQLSPAQKAEDKAYFIIDDDEETLVFDDFPIAGSSNPVKSSGIKSALTALESDLASIHATGSTNTTGAKIDAGTYFYLNDVLVRAKTDIAVNASYTSGTNYETVTAGGLNDLGEIADYSASTAETATARRVGTMNGHDVYRLSVILPSYSDNVNTSVGITITGTLIRFDGVLTQNDGSRVPINHYYDSTSHSMAWVDKLNRLIWKGHPAGSSGIMIVEYYV